MTARDTLRHTPEGVFLGHMLEVDGDDVALAREIFGECWAIGECHCLWVLAIRVVIGLIIGPRRHVLDLWHVYASGDPNVK
jgi:hypothetical protein